MIINRESFSVISSNMVSMRKNTLAIRKTLIRNNRNKDLLKKKTEREDAKLLQNKNRRLDEEAKEAKSAERELKKFRIPKWKLNIKNPLKGFGIPGLGILGGVLSFVGFGLLGWMMNKLPEIIKAVKDFMKKGEGFLKGLTEFWEVVKNVFKTIFGAFELLFKKLGFGGTDALGEGDEQKVKQQFKTMAESLRDFISALPGKLSDLVKGLVGYKISGESPSITTPVEDYPLFDPNKTYKTGDIVNKDGQLRQFDGMGWAEVKSSKLERDILAFRKARTRFGVSGERVLAEDTFNLAIRDLRAAAGGSTISPLADDLKYEAEDHRGRAHAGGYGFDIPVKDKEQADFVINFFRSRGYETIHGRGEDPSGGHDFHVHVQAPDAKAAEFMARGGLPSTIKPVVREGGDDTMGPKREVINHTVELPIPGELLNIVRNKNQPSQEYFKKSMDIQISIDGDDVREGLFY